MKKITKMLSNKILCFSLSLPFPDIFRVTYHKYKITDVKDNSQLIPLHFAGYSLMKYSAVNCSTSSSIIISAGVLSFQLWMYSYH